jgi:hypothetical protein
MTGGFRRFLPSPAMVVAVAALVMSLGGSAYALVITGKSIRNGTVTAKDIRDRSLTGSDLRRDRVGGGSIKESSLGVVPVSVLTGGSTRFAVLNGGGQAVRARGATSAARTGPGRYQVIFDGDVRGCAYFATIGSPGAGGPPQNSKVSVSSLGSNINGVSIRTENNGGAEVDRGVHLIVMC